MEPDQRITRRLTTPDHCALGIEARAEGELPRIIGRAAVFYDGTPDTEYRLLPDLVERIMPRAFNKALSEKQDVRALFNHDDNHVLGRTSAKTLRLSKSLRGLDYEIDPPDTQTARELVESIRRKDITGSSFGFRVLDQKFLTEKVQDGETELTIDIREIHSVELFDISPVTFPAYTATDVDVRATVTTLGTTNADIRTIKLIPTQAAIDSLIEARSARDAWRAEEQVRAAAKANSEQVAATRAKLAAMREQVAIMEASL